MNEKQGYFDRQLRRTKGGKTKAKGGGQHSRKRVRKSYNKRQGLLRNNKKLEKEAEPE